MGGATSPPRRRYAREVRCAAVDGTWTCKPPGLASLPLHSLRLLACSTRRRFQVAAPAAPALAARRGLLPGRALLHCGWRKLAQSGQAARPATPLRQAPRAQAPAGQIVRAEQWEQRRQQVLAFVERHGRLPRRQNSVREPLLPGEQQLGRWCDYQRQRWKGGRQPPLTAGQQAALEAIPGWFWVEHVTLPWEQWLQQVLAFVEQHSRLPRAADSQQEPLLAGEQQLGQWCNRQRQRWNGTAQPPLSTEQQAALEAIPGWAWGAQASWEQRRQQVLAFVEQHGRLPRTKSSRREPLLAGERQLGHWCSRQRQCRKGRVQPLLSAEQQALLEAIPLWRW